MTILEYLLSDQRKTRFLYEVLDAFKLRVVPISYGKKFEILEAEK